MIAFGPVPSRRLGRSLGINNIPPKVCTHSCVYCQLGRTIKMRIDRRAFYEPEDILRSVQTKVERAEESGESIDYLTFVPDGEPTLDVNLGREIELLRLLGIPIAVITNASLVWREDVRDDLMKADWVSLKVDSTRDEVWRRVNRPHGTLQLASIVHGAIEFAKTFRGELVTETMLVAGVNGSDDHLREVTDFLARLRPAVVYLSIPTRPPAEEWVRSPGQEAINRVYQIFSQRLDHVDYLIGYEGNAFAFTGDVEEDLLSITAVHPMREEAVNEFLARARADWSAVHTLIAEGQLIATEYEEERRKMVVQQEPWHDEGRAQRYARWTRISSRAVYAPFAREIVECLAPLPREATIVDLGTGPGLLSIELHKLWPQAKIIGVDPSHEMLKIARKNADKAGMSNFEARLGTAEEMPIESNSVDLVVSQSSLHEWENVQKGFSEIFTVLKPGGTLILKDYNRAWLPNWKRKWFGFFHPLDMFKFTFEEVAALLRKAGFDEIKGEGKGLEWFVQAIK